MAEPWDSWDDERLWSFLRGDKGVDHGSRVWLRERLREWQARSLLDVGCGAGVEYEGLKRDLVKVRYTGVDSCARMIALCEERFPEARWEVGDAEGLPFTMPKFDVVLLRHVLEHLPDCRKAILEACRVAKRAVVLVFCCAPGDAREEMQTPDVLFVRHAFGDVCAALGAGGSLRVEVIRDLGVDANMAVVGWMERPAKPKPEVSEA